MRVIALLNNLSEAMSFDSPEILAVGEETILSWVDSEEELHEFKFPMQNYSTAMNTFSIRNRNIYFLYIVH